MCHDPPCSMICGSGDSITGSWTHSVRRWNITRLTTGAITASALFQSIYFSHVRNLLHRSLLLRALMRLFLLAHEHIYQFWTQFMTLYHMPCCNVVSAGQNRTDATMNTVPPADWWRIVVAGRNSNNTNWHYLSCMSYLINGSFWTQGNLVRIHKTYFPVD
jgi:hypothetical protein